MCLHCLLLRVADGALCMQSVLRVDCYHPGVSWGWSTGWTFDRSTDIRKWGLNAFCDVLWDWLMQQTLSGIGRTCRVWRRCACWCDQKSVPSSRIFSRRYRTRSLWHRRAQPGCVSSSCLSEQIDDRRSRTRMSFPQCAHACALTSESWIWILCRRFYTLSFVAIR